MSAKLKRERSLKNLSIKLTMPCTEGISLYWPGETGRGSLKAPTGLKQRIDELLDYIYESTGAKFSRNEFILKAIRFYFVHLLDAKTKKELVAKMESDADVT